MKKPNLIDHSVIPPRDFQIECYDRFMTGKAFAIYSVPGSGKTKSAIDIACGYFQMNWIDYVLVLSWPSSVRIQWVNEQLPQHAWKVVPHREFYWNKNKMPDWFGKMPREGRQLQFGSFNIEAVSGKVLAMLTTFLEKHGKRTLMIIDESQTIKNATGSRSVAIQELGLLCKYHAIMSGTPYAKNLMDVWAQFKFLDDKIINIEYKTAFHKQFCVMGGYGFKTVIGSKNEDLFNKLIAPYTFRATKEQLGLKDTLYGQFLFDLSTEQYDILDRLKRTFIAEVDDALLKFGEDATLDNVITASNVGVSLIRLQQVANGFVVNEDNVTSYLKDNPRLDEFEQQASLFDEKLVVWARFKPDIKMLMERFGDKAVCYVGGMKDEQKLESKRRFIEDPNVKFFFGNTQSAGAGVDGLQKVCSTALYYSQSFRYLDRAQSEFRTNRLGSDVNSTPSCFDFVARRSVDRLIVRNLKNKKDFSDTTLAALKKEIDNDFE